MVIYYICLLRYIFSLSIRSSSINFCQALFINFVWRARPINFVYDRFFSSKNGTIPFLTKRQIFTVEQFQYVGVLTEDHCLLFLQEEQGKRRQERGKGMVAREVLDQQFQGTGHDNYQWSKRQRELDRL